MKRDPNVSHLSSGPLRGNKGDIWEGGHRVLLMIRFDGTFPTNETRDNLVGLNDIYATLCDFLGIEVPALSAQVSVSLAGHIISAIIQMVYAIVSASVTSKKGSLRLIHC